MYVICLLEDDKAGPIDYFVVEYCSGGDLRKAIEDAKQSK